MKIKTAIATIGLLTSLITAPITTQVTVHAAEYTVAPVSMVLYTNAATILLNDADTNNVLMQFPSGLPVNVVGITSNGYFKIEINGATYYVVAAGLQETAPTEATTPTTGWTQEKVYEALMYLKETKYPQGTPWGDNKHESYKELENNGIVYTRDGYYGGRAFSRRLMKDIFGEDAVLQEGYATDISQLKIGDIIDFDDNDVVIVEITDKYVKTVEGNAHMYDDYGVVDWTNWGYRYYKTGVGLPIEDMFKVWEELDDGTWIQVPGGGVFYYTAY